MKRIPGFNKYEITVDGIVVSFNIKGIKPIQPVISRGYMRVGIVNDAGLRKHMYVHRLVALTYIEPVLGKECINHIDGNKFNNYYKNLEWVTAHENSTLAAKAGLYDVRCGSRNHASRIVLNTETGIFYDTITEAANTIQYNRFTLRAMIAGIQKNKTPFIYI